ncbi:hypothetical protein EPI10_025235 [Gossypium australe]|uniref:Copia protein n=1 Tax=Gossypium australe TaxID=47621 RepID=A0A5B6VZG1_9ROSI|nr:hypothetical protein EPI10_025235 [Gossypium australe]
MVYFSPKDEFRLFVTWMLIGPRLLKIDVPPQGPNPVVWCSKKQNVVSRSSSETEYRSLANYVSELLWVKQLIDEIGLSSCLPPMIWCDNTFTVSIAANPTHHAQMKHVEIDHHFVQEKVLDGTLKVNFVLSSEQVVDVLTKPITPKQFE